MGEAIEQCGGHFRIAEHAGPFAEAQVGGDDDTGALGELGSRRWNSSAPPEALNGRYPSSSRITNSVSTSTSAIFPALPWAFSCSGALTNSTVGKKRTRLR